MFLLRIALIFSMWSVLHLPGAEPSKVIMYRVVVPTAIPGTSADVSLDANVQLGLLLGYLLKKDECDVEKICEATIGEGKFSLDKTFDVHFFLQEKDGSFSLKTAERKGGCSLSGTIKAEEKGYLLEVNYMLSYVTNRAQLGFEKNLAPDLAVGLPDMSTTMLTSRARALVGVPVCLGSGPTVDQSRSAMTFLVLE